MASSMASPNFEEENKPMPPTNMASDAPAKPKAMI
jgi:hypothetical protein